MFFLAILALVGACSCQEQYDYQADQDNVLSTTPPDNQYTTYDADENGYTTTIEDLMDVNSTSDLMYNDQAGQDNVTSTTLPDNENTTYDIDENGYLIIENLTDSNSTTDLLYNYYADLDNIILTTLPGNQYITYDTDENGNSEVIEYLMDINSTTGLMIRMIFGDDDGPLDAQNAEDTRMNICDILDRAVEDPDSFQAQYYMPQSLGLGMMQCPIEKGIKELSPYKFPTEFTSKDLGCGDRYYNMRVEAPNQDLDSEPILELRVNLTLLKANETCAENSGANVFVPSVIASLAIAFVCQSI